jgi:uncharacterized repeat protein (TIGR01451 family)
MVKLGNGFLGTVSIYPAFQTFWPLPEPEESKVAKNSLRLESRELVPTARNRTSLAISDSLFFKLYSKVSAFNTTLKKPNEAVDLFSSSRLELEEKLEESSSEENLGAEIAAYHSILALIHWLYPNHRGYDRLRNASKMYDHAIEATSYSKYSISESYVVGLFVQLRVLPFLIRSNKPFGENLAKARESALSLVTALESSRSNSISGLKFQGLGNLQPEQIDGFRGILLDGLGFSYWAHERDVEVALRYLQQSVECLVEVDKRISKNRNSSYVESARNEKPRKISSDAMRDFYSAMISVSYWDLGHCYEGLADKFEGDELIRYIKKARVDYEKSYTFAKRTTWNNYKGLSAYMIAGTYETETQVETEKKKIKELLKKAITIGDEALRWLSLWSSYESDFLGGSWIAACYGRLADYSGTRLRQKYMLHSLKLAKKAEDLIVEGKSNVGGKLFSAVQIGEIFSRNSDYYRQLAISQKSSLRYPHRSEKKEKILVIEPLKKSLEYSIRSKAYYKEEIFSKQAVEARLLAGDSCYELLSCDISDNEKREYSSLGKRVCREAQAISRKNGWNESVAESNWLLAQILDLEGKYAKSAGSYLEAYEFYEKARKGSEHGTTVYHDFANFMLAWNKIELAKIAHVSSDFEKAANHYSEAASLISRTREWSKGSTLFFAESLIERGESKSLEEEGLNDSVELFDQAVSSLSKFYEETKKDASAYLTAFSALAQQLTIFCRARKILEQSKEDYRTGDIERSISRLSSAETMFEDLASNPIISDSLRSNELQSMASLCRALGSFQKAQLNEDPELYLESRKIFGRASEESKSKSLRPLLAGLASFASFLFYSNQVEKSLETKLDVDQVAECNKALQTAESNFNKVGNKSFLNILKASKHILDATIKMSSAEREVEQAQVKAKLYAEAQRSLSLASRYYRLVGSSKRLKEALKMIGAVRNHQRLIPLAHDLISEIASNQIIYTAITSSSVIEQTPHSSSRGLGSSYVSFDCEINKPYTQVGEILKISFKISNLGRAPITAVKIDEIVPEGFEVVECQIGFSDGHSLKLNKRVDAETSKILNVSYRPTGVGEFSWHPSLIYLDASKNFRIARSQVARSVVEHSNTSDYSSLLKLKSNLEAQIEALKSKIANEVGFEREKLTDEMYTIREKISRIEEEFLRTKNEYALMTSEIQTIQSDIQSLERRNSSTIEDFEEKENLKAQERLLQARIERRRLLLEQAQLL